MFIFEFIWTLIKTLITIVIGVILIALTIAATIAGFAVLIAVSPFILIPFGIYLLVAWLIDNI